MAVAVTSTTVTSKSFVLSHFGGGDFEARRVNDWLHPAPLVPGPLRTLASPSMLLMFQVCDYGGLRLSLVIPSQLQGEAQSWRATGSVGTCLEPGNQSPACVLADLGQVVQEPSCLRSGASSTSSLAQLHFHFHTTGPWLLPTLFHICPGVPRCQGGPRHVRSTLHLP